MEYAIKKNDYFELDVVDINISGIKLYEKIEFKVYTEVLAKYFKKTKGSNKNILCIILSTCQKCENKVRPWLPAVRPGQDGDVQLLTAVKALCSEYLAWPTANIVGFELQLFKATGFERMKEYFCTKYSLPTMLRLTAGRYVQCPAKSFVVLGHPWPREGGKY